MKSRSVSATPSPAAQVQVQAGDSDKKYTLEEAFNYFFTPHDQAAENEDSLNIERCVRSVAFLLTYSSNMGNDALDGNAANGLARILEGCAISVERLQRYNDRQLEWAKKEARTAS